MEGSFDSSTTACHGATGGHRGETPAQRGQPGTGADVQRRQREEQRRQEQERLEAERHRQEAERQRKAEAERRAFEKARQGALELLKGTSPDAARLKGMDDPPHREGTDFFGVRGTPAEGLKLKPAVPPAATGDTKDAPGPAAKTAEPERDTGFLRVDTHSSPVDTRTHAIELPPLDPAVFKRPVQRLRIRAVPSPTEAPKGTWARYVKGGTADLILDALEVGDGDLDQSIAYLDSEMARHGTHHHAEGALSFLEGLRISYIGADAEWRQSGGRDGGEPVPVESTVLLEAISGISRQRWPGPENPEASASMGNPLDWRIQRTERMLDALQRNPGELMQAFRDLDNEQVDRITAANARHYLQGIYAYMDFLAREEAK